MRLPEVAERLRQLAATHGIIELDTLADEIRRRRPSRVAPVKSAPMTPVLRGQIRLYARANPTLTQAEIGRRFNVNPGRVSEALRGFRT